MMAWPKGERGTTFYWNYCLASSNIQYSLHWRRPREANRANGLPSLTFWIVPEKNRYELRKETLLNFFPNIKRMKRGVKYAIITLILILGVIIIFNNQNKEDNIAPEIETEEADQQGKALEIQESPQEESSQESSEDIPEWVRNNAEWWSSGEITEDDFVNAIKYLVQHGIIRA